MFDVIMPFYIYLPNLPNIDTLCTAVDRERLSVFRVGHRAQKSGHLWCRPSFRSAVSASLLQAPRVEQHVAVFFMCVFRDHLITSGFRNLSTRFVVRYSY